MFSKSLSASLLVAAVSDVGVFAQWNYDNLGDDWNATSCREGRNQSPFDLFKPAVIDNTMKIEGFDYKDLPTGLAIKKRNNVLRISMQNQQGTLVTTFPDGTTDAFTTAQINFNAPSEHTINGEHLPFEMDFAHKNEDTGEQANIGILFVVGDEENEFIESLQFDKATEDGYPLTDVPLATFLSGLDMSKFWYYNGS